MKSYKIIDYILNLILLLCLLACFFLIINGINVKKIINMMQPFIWMLTFYCSVSFYFYWYLLDVKFNNEKGDSDFIKKSLINKKKYRNLGCLFGVLLLLSILF